jgi:hypothetical protein
LKSGGPASIPPHNPNNFTAATGRKDRWGLGHEPRGGGRGEGKGHNI